MRAVWSSMITLARCQPAMAPESSCPISISGMEPRSGSSKKKTSSALRSKLFLEFSSFSCGV